MMTDVSGDKGMLCGGIMVMWPLTFDPEISFCSVAQILDSVLAGLYNGVLHGNVRVLQSFAFALILVLSSLHITSLSGDASPCLWSQARYI
jgi:hypothetical protein